MVDLTGTELMSCANLMAEKPIIKIGGRWRSTGTFIRWFTGEDTSSYGTNQSRRENSIFAEFNVSYR